MEQQLLDHILLLYEASNWILMGYSNKGRDVPRKFSGEWCNIGADSNNSNLKK
jgi:hypothetical protein